MHIILASAVIFWPGLFASRPILPQVYNVNYISLSSQTPHKVPTQGKPGISSKKIAPTKPTEKVKSAEIKNKEAISAKTPISIPPATQVTKEKVYPESMSVQKPTKKTIENTSADKLSVSQKINELEQQKHEQLLERERQAEQIRRQRIAESLRAQQEAKRAANEAMINQKVHELQEKQKQEQLLEQERQAEQIRRQQIAESLRAEQEAKKAANEAMINQKVHELQEKQKHEQLAEQERQAEHIRRQRIAESLRAEQEAKRATNEAMINQKVHELQEKQKHEQLAEQERQAEQIRRQQIAESLRAQQEANEATEELNELRRLPDGTTNGTNGSQKNENKDKETESNQNPVEKGYLASISSRIQQFWALPEFEKWDPSLMATIVITINQDGRIISQSFQEHSKNKLFDQYVEKTLQRAAPLPPIPAALKKSQFEIGLFFKPTGLQNKK